MQQSLLITIDGPSGSGKGTLARLIAEHYGLNMLDSGAIYRAVAYIASWYSLDLGKESGISKVIEYIEKDFYFDLSEHAVIPYFKGESIDLEIREEYVSELASRFAVFPQVRESLLSLQRSFNKPPGLVADGRDMGEIVFPSADIKVYLDASVQTRAERRYIQLQEKGLDVNLSDILKKLEERDKRDKSREHSPLVIPEGAIVIDSSQKTSKEVFDLVCSSISNLV